MKTAQTTKIRFTLLALAISFTLCALRLSEANAQSTTRSFTISPPSIQLSLKPGDKTEKIIKITNNSDETMEFIADVKDFIVTDKAGTPELLSTGTKLDNKFSAASWTTVLPDKLTVKPGQRMTTTIYIQVPGDARPGGRYVAVTFLPLAGGAPEQTGAAVNTIAANLVYLTVLGPTKENARVVSFKTPLLSEFGPINFATEIQNLGDLHISPRATIEVKNMVGQKSFSTSLGDLNIFPGTSRLYESSWQTKWLLGRYTARLSGYYGQAGNLSLLAMTSFWVIPYRLILILVLAAAVALAVFTLLKKRQEKETA